MNLHYWIFLFSLACLTACNFIGKSQESFFVSVTVEALSESQNNELEIIKQEFGDGNIAILKLNTNWRKNYSELNLREEILFNYLNNYYLLSSTYYPSLISQNKANNWLVTTPNDLSSENTKVFDEISKFSIISFLSTDDGLQGAGFVADQKFYIRPLGNNYHVFISANIEQIPYNDHDDDDFEVEDTDELEDDLSVYEANDIKILHIITNKAKDRITARYTKKVEQYVDQLIDHSNQTFTAQEIDLTVSNAGIHFIDYKPVNSKIDVERLAALNDNFLDSVHKLRDDAQADVVSLIVESHIGNRRSCGRVRKINSNYQSAFFTVRYDCAFGKFSYLHEIGHLVGCRHNPEADPSETYNHGHYERTQKWRSVMSYDCCTIAQRRDPNVTKPCCTRHPTWSDPSLKLPNKKLKGVKNISENIRVWKGNNALEIANLHENKPSILSDGYLPNDSSDAVADEPQQ